MTVTLYGLRSLCGEVVWVGQTVRPSRRMSEHAKLHPEDRFEAWVEVGEDIIDIVEKQAIAFGREQGWPLRNVAAGGLYTDRENFLAACRVGGQNAIDSGHLSRIQPTGARGSGPGKKRSGEQAATSGRLALARASGGFGQKGGLVGGRAYADKYGSPQTVEGCVKGGKIAGNKNASIPGRMSEIARGIKRTR